MANNKTKNISLKSFREEKSSQSSSGQGKPYSGERRLEQQKLHSTIFLLFVLFYQLFSQFDPLIKLLLCVSVCVRVTAF